MTTPQQRAHNGEAGYMLLAVVVMVALVILALSVAAPVVARDLRRDKEVESVHRAEQYVRAIRLYQRACKCTSYPPSMDALEKGTTMRFLREKYVDPLTGKSDWRLIHQPKTTIKIPFGQELSGLAGGNLGSAAGLSSGVGAPVGGGSAPSGAVPALGAGFGDSSSSSGSGTSSFGSSSSSGSSSSFGSSSSSSGSGTGTGTGSSTPGSSSGSSSDTGMFGDSSGGVIYGVGSSRSGTSILNPNQQTTYETWEFWYDPRIERLYAMAQPLGGGGIGSQAATGSGIGSQSASSFGQNATSGQSNSGGSSSGSGTNSTSSPTSGLGSSNSSTFP
ncbi:MAG TPA: type II secretion system protein [Granulicella sp.]